MNAIRRGYRLESNGPMRTEVVAMSEFRVAKIILPYLIFQFSFVIQ